jgi:hypothetical protein
MVSWGVAPVIGGVRGRRGLARSWKDLAAGLLTGSLIAAMALVAASPAWAGEAFGVESLESFVAGNQEGARAVQAGSHPYAMTTAITFNHVVTAIEEEQPPRVRIYGDPKDIEVNMPQGVIIDPSATETKCTEAELERGDVPTGCPNAAAVGVFSIYLDGIEVVDEPVYNMAPAAGVPAELGFNAAGVGLIMHIEGKIRTGGDYGISADISDIPQEHPIYAVKLTLWGDPSNASHDQERGLCADGEAKQRRKEALVSSSCPVERTTTPFLTLPSACTSEPLTTISADSWQEPGSVNPDGTPDLNDPRWQTATSSAPPLTGCEDLDFSPKLTVSTAEPEAASAESPSGLNVDLKLPPQENVSGLAEADLREAAVTLPVGMAISPPAADGRQACTPEEIELGTAQAPSCPDASKAGAAEIVTPLLEDPLEGSIYLAQQDLNPFNSLLALYLVAEGDGVLVKLAGKVEANPQTGQLTVTFGDLPQIPISELRLSFFGGPRAMLATPAACGIYEARSALTPWSGRPSAIESSSLEIDSGPNGGACPDGQFNPSFAAGTVNNQAGASSSFVLTLSRQDGEQRFGAFAVRLPPGLSGILKDVARCPEPQASLGECPQSSAIGTTTVGVGPGGDPFYLPELGRPTNEVYLTGPTLPQGSNPSGAPFGLSIVVPAIAGPFDLGNVIMRATIDVDPRTAQLTIASDPGVGGIPVIKEGIPLDIRTLNITIDRPGFIVNPTSCAPQTVSGVISSTGGTSAVVSNPFAATNCASLPFKPKLLALTHAKASRKGGAYLHVKVVSGPGQANLGKLKVDLPKLLPARMTTLQKACPANVFEADPAACSAASIVGAATVVTPMLAARLTGPAYLVSHGGLALPDLVMVLQGEGITLEEEGQLRIERGVASSTFRALPDVPLSTLDLVLSMGPHSAFTVGLPAERGLCSQTLKMPTAITAQNGAQVKQVTRVAVSGCPEHKQAGEKADKQTKAGKKVKPRAARRR